MEFEDWQQILRRGAHVLGCPLDESQIHCFAHHMREMLHWNRKINLTRIVAPEEIAVKHFLDAIAPVDHIPATARILDIGSGAGFPGIPLKVVRPSCPVTLLERSRKKANFLRHVIRQLPYDDLKVVENRIEDFAADPVGMDRFDTVVGRAFASMATAARLAAPWLKTGAELLLWKGPEIGAEISELRNLSSGPVGKLVARVHPYQLPHTAHRRNLVSIRMAPEVRQRRPSPDEATANQERTIT